VYHVDFQRVVLAIYMMLGRRVHVELNEAEVDASKGRGAIYEDFDGGAQVLEFHLVDFWDVQYGGFGGDGNGGIWRRMLVRGCKNRIMLLACVPRLMGD